jgi:protein-S-isoprenylcysteine O-methyltransferase Ste14
VYLAALLTLFVRFVDPEATRASRHLVASAADLAMVRRHHVVFYALLVAAPLEWWLRGRPSGWAQLAGAGLILAGVVGYRRAGRALGDQLSPLVAPCEPAALVKRGPYSRLRHPMYLAELAIAVGAPVALGAWLTLVPTAVFTALVLQRIAAEERRLGARLADYADYAAHTYRLVPYVY